MNDEPFLKWYLGELKDMSNDYTPKPDKGTLFPNKFKKNESHPDYIGQYAMPDGTIREFAAWLNAGKDQNYLSVRFSDAYDASKRSA